MNSYITHFECSSCSRNYPTHNNPTFCKGCKAPLLARYDLARLQEQLDKEDITQRPKSGIWKWKELLPLEDPSHLVSLGEGDTPLIPLPTLCRRFGFTNLFLKEEGRNPAGSFKARGFSVAVSKAIENHQMKLILPSAGNAGGALAAYAARAGIQARIFMPETTPAAIINECRVAGAEVLLINGTISDCGKIVDDIAMAEGWHPLSTFKEPYRVEGKKTMGFELALQFNWSVPEVIIFPTGGGTGLVGIWKAFTELRELGWISNEKIPRLIAVQSSGCAPLVKAFQEGAEDCEFWHDAHTIARGLQVPLSFASRLILKIIRDTSGYCVAVEDEMILKAEHYLHQTEGLAVSPEGAASLAGALQLLETGLIDPEEDIVIFNTASAVKYI